MEATAALGLAGNITQFLEFSIKLCATVSHIYHSGGITKHNAQTELLTTTFAASLDTIRVDLSTYSTYLSSDASTGGETQAIVNGCRTVALTLLDRLGRLKLDGRTTGRWKSIKAAIVALWNEKELSEMESELYRLQTGLQWAVVVSLRKSMDLLQYRQQDQFQRLQSSISAVLAGLIESKTKSLPEWPVHVDAPNPASEICTHASTLVPDTGDTPANNDQHPSEQDEPENEYDDSPNARLARMVAGNFARAEKAVLESLNFTLMYDRETEIAPAEAATFDWIFEDPQTTDRPWSNFQNWLSAMDGQRIYWISGKAGSGKSTLMKHLTRHPQTRQALAQWANGTRLLLSSFFFWYSGLDLQKSQLGLFRGLLYSCLKEHRELIPVVVPETASLREEDLRDYWTVSRLRTAMNRLVSQRTFDIKFAFFIDGLDEYAGAYNDVISTLGEMAAQENVKICSSSRPLLPFETAFSTSPHLILQYLTHDDISLYAKGKLGQHDRMVELEQDEPGLQAELTWSIVNKASGVFLWVYLVVSSLLDGLGNYDVGNDLKRRLDDLPAELEALYWHMVDRVRPAWYLEEGFRLLRMVKASSGTSTLLQLCFAEMPEDLVFKHGLLRKPTLAKQKSLCRDMSGRLKSRCLGLLELTGDPERPSTQPVSFIHKSVFDFLETDAVQTRIKACPGHEKYQPEVALLRASILELKTLPTLGGDTFTRGEWFDFIRPMVGASMKLARSAEAASGQPNVTLLRSLKDTVDHLWRSVHPKTIKEECGEVHWISAPRLSGPSSRCTTYDPSSPPQLTLSKTFEPYFLDEEAQVVPGTITCFDELCQKAGLDLYARAVGREPQATLVIESHQGHVSSISTGLKAAAEILPETTQPAEGENPIFSPAYHLPDIADSYNKADPECEPRTVSKLVVGLRRMGRRLGRKRKRDENGGEENIAH